MSREIKFRAWSTFHDKKELIYLNEFTSKDLKSCDNWKVMQYTGLKDKNGKEIYEGDILRINHGDNIDELEYYSDGDTYQVIFKDCCYWGKCIYTLRPSTTPLETLLSDLDYWEPQSKEIIGNIYKNKELITGGKNV